MKEWSALSDKLGAIGNKLRIRTPKAPAEAPYSGLYDALTRMGNDDALLVAEKIMKANFAMVNDPGFARWLAEGNNRSLLSFRIKGRS